MVDTARPSTLQPLASWPAAACRHIHGVLTDIDDTLTTDGAITPDALHALASLKSRGLHIIPITGRPVGWSEPFITAWPVDAIVTENGAVALRRVQQRLGISALGNTSPQPPSVSKSYLQSAATRTANYARMQQVLARIEREVPNARRATDSPGRETDIAIDHSEFTQLPQQQMDHVVRLMRSSGMNATVSSIHINGWFGTHNKLEGARWIVREMLGRDLDAEIDRWVYVGDSTNDQLMFQHFPHSVGVANIARFVPQLTHLPRYVTESERGAGFAEVARRLLLSRGPAPSPCG